MELQKLRTEAAAPNRIDSPSEHPRGLGGWANAIVQLCRLPVFSFSGKGSSADARPVKGGGDARRSAGGAAQRREEDTWPSDLISDVTEVMDRVFTLCSGSELSLI